MCEEPKSNMNKVARFVVLSLSVGLAVGIPVASLVPIVKAQTSTTTSPDPYTTSPSATSTHKPTRHKKTRHTTSGATPSATATPGNTTTAPTPTNTTTP